MSPSSAAKIFIAEDNPGDVRLIREALKLHNVEFELQVYEDGETALTSVSQISNSAAGIPDLILLDLNLPKLDGREVLRHLKETPRLQNVPVIVLSSSHSPHDQADAASLGATRYIRKPSTLDEFLHIGALAKELLPSHS